MPVDSDALSEEADSSSAAAACDSAIEADSAALWAAASDAATAAFDSATLAAILEDSCSEARRADSDFEAATALSEAAIDSETDSEADIDAYSLAFEIDSTFCVLEIMTCSVDSGSGTLSSLFT